MTTEQLEEMGREEIRGKRKFIEASIRVAEREIAEMQAARAALQQRCPHPSRITHHTIAKPDAGLPVVLATWEVCDDCGLGAGSER